MQIGKYAGGLNNTSSYGWINRQLQMHQLTKLRRFMVKESSGIRKLKFTKGFIFKFSHFTVKDKVS
jgi:hypothetical protein